MIPNSKLTLPISIILLATLVALQFNGCESGLFSKTRVEMTNKLPNELQLGFHCKDKNHDLGSQNLLFNQSWSFKFRKNLFADITLYFCRFYWLGGDQWFDIYDEERDKALGNFQPWDILETGPCRNRWDTESRQCFNWNKNNINADDWRKVFDDGQNGSTTTTIDGV